MELLCGDEGPIRPDDVVMLATRRDWRTAAHCRACFVGCEASGTTWHEAYANLPCRWALMEMSADAREGVDAELGLLLRECGEMCRRERAMEAAEDEARGSM